MITATMTTDPNMSAMYWDIIGGVVTGPVTGVWTITAPDEVTQAVLDMHVANSVAEAVARASAAERIALITGAKTRARQITALSLTPTARTGTAWTQVQRVAILDAIGDMAKMLSWVADDILGVSERPDTLI